MVIACLVTCLIHATFGLVERETTIEDIAKGLRARSEAFRSGTMTLKIHVTKRSELTGITHDYAVVNEVQLDRVLGRFRSHLHGSSLFPPAAFKGNKEYLGELDQITAFDGERTRIYTRFPAYDAAGNKSGRFLETGRIYPKGKPNWIVPPDSLIASFSWKPILELFKEYAWTVEGREGDLVIAQSSKIHQISDTDKSDYRTRIWFDSRKGMAPVRGQSLTLREGDRDWIVTWEIVLDEWEEIKPGLWLPKKSTDAASWGDPGQPPRLVERHIAEISYSDINTDFNSETFKLKFPSGVEVTDSERGTRYKSATITDDKLDSDARKSLELRAMYEVASASIKPDNGLAPKWMWILLGTGGIAIFAITSIVYVKATWRRQSGKAEHV